MPKMPRMKMGAPAKKGGANGHVNGPMGMTYGDQGPPKAHPSMSMGEASIPGMGKANPKPMAPQPYKKRKGY